MRQAIPKLIGALLPCLMTGAASIAPPRAEAAASPLLELYVDTETKQIFAEPGDNRVKLGTFQAVEEQQRVQEDLAAMEERLESKEKALEEKMEKTALSLQEWERKQMASAHKNGWYDTINVRGYTQLRYNQMLSGDRRAGPGESRLRSVHDRSVGDDTGFSLRRIRLIFFGDLNDYVYFYLQPDFASAVSNQSNNERRENFVQLRDAYVDIHFDKAHTFKVRAGQSKVPFGWENLQSSQNRLALDRADVVNAAVPSERDLGVVAYYTPTHVQKVWKRLRDDKQKLFGNYGMVGFGVFNGQGVNRTEKNDEFMYSGILTYPFELDALGSLFKGQVLELGGYGMRNRIRPEVRGGGVTDNTLSEERVGVHAVLYPQPFGFQTEWNWGKGPEFDRDSQQIEEKNLRGGYVQLMYKIDDFYGNWMPYAKWQTFRGGWKSSTNSPRAETDEVEVGVEWQIMKQLELTFAYSKMKRAEIDERRSGRARGDLLRMQLQWNY